MDKKRGHLVERDADGVWQLTDAGREYLADQAVCWKGYTVRMGMLGEGLLYWNAEPEKCIEVRPAYLSRAAALEWIERVAA